MKYGRTIAAVLTSSAIGIGVITNWEGFSPVVYTDLVGVPTIGYGTTQGVKPGDTMTEAEARSRLVKEVENEYGAAVKRCVNVPLYQSEYDAYVSLTYNIGATAFCRSTLVRKLNAGEYSEACNQILRWNRAGGRVVQGLVNRRKAEHALCTKDHKYDAPKTA
jgi:lysozyme